MVNRSEEDYRHLVLRREEPVTERRPRRPPLTQKPTPEQARSHGQRLGDRLRTIRSTQATEVGGHDDRVLLKIDLKERVSPEYLARAASDIEIVSHEDETLVLAFATEEQLELFEAKLNDLAIGGEVTYTRLLYAIQDLDQWTADDRTGWALRQEGFPNSDSFVIDAELWPVGSPDQMERQRSAFQEWVENNNGFVLDSVRQPHLTIYRIRCVQSLAEDLLRYRDVRTVDLPPRVGLEPSLIMTDIQQLERIAQASESAPGVVVLDSGLVTGHPVLAPAVGDAQGFPSHIGSDDEDGHGTSVSGVALYDDVAACVENGLFVPELRLFSGRVLDDENGADGLFIENRIDEAVRYFVANYGCRIFNLSYGDYNKPYLGRHVAGLAVTLDALSRELGLLFIVPTGNYRGDCDGPSNWRTDYPRYLTGDSSSLLDPSTALNVLTVGSLARNEQIARWQNDPAYIPIARTDQPSPFTRHGPTVNLAIKPDLVDYGGNWVIDGRDSGGGRNPMAVSQGVGELSTSRDFATLRPFTEVYGTSFAAPRVAHAAAKILAEIPDATANLCRALLLAHARTPRASEQLFGNDKEALRKVTGYGIVDRSALYRSLDSCVTLWADERIENRSHHFYEIPVPAEFWQADVRERQLTVALASSPVVRTTRIDYKASSISFKLVQARSIGEVVQWFNAAVDSVGLESIGERQSGRSVSERDRSRGTAQACTWTFKNPSSEVRNSSSWFVVVTRNDPPWGTALSAGREPYALAVTLSDRLAERPRLHLQVQAELRNRAEIRARARS